VPLTIGGCLPAAAVAEAGASRPSSFRVWSVVPSIAETMFAAPLMVVRVRVAVIVLMLKWITPVIAMPVSIALPHSAIVGSHSRALH
jgi:hypothetical protein